MILFPHSKGSGVSLCLGDDFHQQAVQSKRRGAFQLCEMSLTGNSEGQSHPSPCSDCLQPGSSLTS